MFVIMRSVGEYEEFSNNPIAVTDNEDEAKALILKLEQKARIHANKRQLVLKFRTDLGYDLPNGPAKPVFDHKKSHDKQYRAEYEKRMGEWFKLASDHYNNVILPIYNEKSRLTDEYKASLKDEEIEIDPKVPVRDYFDYEVVPDIKDFTGIDYDE